MQIFDDDQLDQLDSGTDSRQHTTHVATVCPYMYTVQYLIYRLIKLLPIHSTFIFQIWLVFSSSSHDNIVYAYAHQVKDLAYAHQL